MEGGEVLVAQIFERFLRYLVVTNISLLLNAISMLTTRCVPSYPSSPEHQFTNSQNSELESQDLLRTGKERSHFTLQLGVNCR